MPLELALSDELSKRQYYIKANRLLSEYDKLYKALYDLINDLNSRSEDGVVNCSNWVYQQALSALESDI